MSINNHPTTTEVRHTQLLNGWWDIQPVAHADLGIPLEPGLVPVDGWENAAFLVPGFFTDHAYPETWRQGRNAWTRTQFSVTPEEMKIGRAVLLVQAAIPRAYIFVNGVLVANQEDRSVRTRGGQLRRGGGSGSGSGAGGAGGRGFSVCDADAGRGDGGFWGRGHVGFPRSNDGRRARAARGRYAQGARRRRVEPICGRRGAAGSARRGPDARDRSHPYQPPGLLQRSDKDCR